MEMQSFERVFMRTLRQIYDVKKQLTLSLDALSARADDDEFAATLTVIESQSRRQIERLERIFALLYQQPRTEASWVSTAILRDAWEAMTGGELPSTEGCAAALLALKRYELTLYEILLRWSERCDLYEALPAIRRSIAEEMLQASILSGLAFDSRAEAVSVGKFDQRALH